MVISRDLRRNRGNTEEHKEYMKASLKSIFFGVFLFNHQDESKTPKLSDSKV